MEGDHQHAVRVFVSHLAVGLRRAERGEERAARAHDELADAAGVVELAGRVLRSEALVVVRVAAQHDVGVGVVEVLEHRLHHVALPSWPELNRGWCQNASVHDVGLRRQIGPQPLLLR